MVLETKSRWRRELRAFRARWRPPLLNMIKRNYKRDRPNYREKSVSSKWGEPQRLKSKRSKTDWMMPLMPLEVHWRRVLSLEEELLFSMLLRN